MMMKTFTETEHTELKRQYSDSVAKEIVAFLNTDGGTIYVGVDDGGCVCGVSDFDQTMRKLADIIESQILPTVPEYVSLGSEYVDGKHVVKIQIKKGDSLYYIKKYGRSAQGCFIRVGTSVRSMTERQIDLAQQKYWSSRIKITEIEGSVKNPTFKYLRLLLSEQGYNISDDTFEENMHLRTTEGKYNRQAELLADKNEISVKVVRFAGKDKSAGVVNRNEYGNKCLIVAMNQAFDYCADVINETRVSIQGAKRKETSLFDKEVFREVWFNACLHNNWMDGTPPAIYVFTDHIEIISTGGIPQNLSKEDFFRGISKPVNEELARLFIRLNLMEQTGHGVPLVVSRYGEKVFEFLDFFLRVRIPFAFELNPNEGEKNDSENGFANFPGNVTERQKRIIEFLRGDRINDRINDRVNDRVNAALLASVFSVSEPTIRRDLAQLSKAGIIRHVGSRKGGRWEVVEK